MYINELFIVRLGLARGAFLPEAETSEVFALSFCRRQNKGETETALTDVVGAARDVSAVGRNVRSLQGIFLPEAERCKKQA